ncbi:MAG: hypothetical protein JNM27_13455 [Leptospirales bacterium]|nr:hypothetical protein [Leptospirales bacterium]
MMQMMPMEDLRQSFLQTVGLKDFKRFLAGLRSKTRLLAWQETLWKTFQSKEPRAPSEYSDIVRALVRPDRIPVTRSQFLANPVEYWHSPYFEVETEWLAAAWENEEFRDSVCYEISNSVSKTGEFNLCAITVEALAGVLSSEQAYSLYQYVARNAERSRKEWSPAFFRFFPQAQGKISS